MIRFFLFISALWAAAVGAVAEPRPVTVFAAASLRGVLEDAGGTYEETLNLSFGGSGTMARQIAAGAPADLVILANTNWMDWLAKQGVTGAAAARPVTANTLVLIGAADAPPLEDPATLPARLGTDRLAMGQRDAVPAGIYARQWLTSVRLWEPLAPHLAETDNVRAALALVARGEAPLGIVYASDAQAEPRVRVLYAIPGGTHDLIRYPAAALTPAGAELLTHLLSPAVQDRFAAHGFARLAR